MEIVSVVISILALGISGWTLWATMLKRGTVKMTRPTTIFFGPDNSPDEKSAKVYMRYLLFSTSRRGRVVESMFVRVRSPEAVQAFPIWVYGNKDLARGSGIFVGPEGVAANHHFLLPKGVTGFHFKPGKNSVEVVAQLVGDKHEIVLGEWTVSVSSEQAGELRDKNAGVYFDWGGDHKDYASWTEVRPEAGKLPPLTPSILELMSREFEGRNK